MNRPLIRSRRRKHSHGSISQLKFEALEPKNLLAANFLDFSVLDASSDSRADTVFESGALNIDYNVDVTSGDLVAVEIFAQSGAEILKLGEYFTATATGALISLEGFSNLDGLQQIFGVASTSDGQHATSSPVAIEVLETTTEVGTFRGTDFVYQQSANSAYVLRALGGTDTLALNFDASAVTDFNGAPLASFDADAFVSSQAFYQGSTYDYLTTNDGRELYFQGVERLEFANGSVLTLQTQPNDPEFLNQWDISTGDVGDAWRFTRGSEEILLVSLDTGVAVSNGVPTTSDIDQSRTDYIVPDNVTVSSGDHGHRATSVMVAEPNNNFGLTGINWESPTLIIDVYNNNPPINGARLTNAIQASLDFLETSSASRIIFQGGIQGEFWLNTINQSLISDHADSTLYSVAAGNGGRHFNDSTADPVYSAGVARLAGTYDNVMAIGALAPSFQRVHGVQNAFNLPLAGYSNFGEDMTFAAPSRTRSIGPTGIVRDFGGTSNANPVVAAYSSLVWSIDPELTAVEVRDIMSTTAMDLGDPGRDPEFGWGTPDIGSAVRRAFALTENEGLANLGVNPFSAGDVDLGYLLATSNKLGENIDTSAGSVEFGLLSTTNTNLDSLDFSLVNGTGDADNASFEIVGNSLRIKQGASVDFESKSTYSIRVEVNDGFAIHEQELMVEVIDDSESTTFTLGSDGSQHSMLDRFVVEFDGLVTLGSTPFEIVKRGAEGGTVAIESQIDNSSGNSIVTLTFSGSFTNKGGSLIDGHYQLTIFGDQIQTLSGQNFDADGDGVAGGNLVFGDTESDNFFRLFGDATGDGAVDASDLLRFRRTWLAETDEDNFNPNFDSNADGTVNAADLLPFRKNWLADPDFV